MWRSIALAILVASTASAADVPLDAARLVLEHDARSGRERLAFTSHDADVVVPAQSPLTDSPGGAVLELFVAGDGDVVELAPAVAGRPGWRVQPRRVRFDDRHGKLGTPIASIDVAAGRSVRLTSRVVGVPLATPLRAVAVRLTLGEVRFCARFADASVVRDGHGRFEAAYDGGPALADCSDATLHGACSDGGGFVCNGACPAGGVCLPDISGACHCALPTDPCDTTAPACNGTCAGGAGSCQQIAGYPFPGCKCLTPDSCELSGFPACGGTCDAGQVCRPATDRAGYRCVCNQPGPCGSGGLDCPYPSVCTLIPPSAQCFPILCGSNYPTCGGGGGGGCGAGLACQPVAVNQGTSTFCFCGIDGQACGDNGGFTCPAGEVCRFDGGTFACGAP